MNIRIKDSLSIKTEEGEHIIRSGTVGVEKKRIVYFYDTTKTCAVGFPRDLCIENTALFSITRTIVDREVPLSDVLAVINKVDNPDIRELLSEQIQSL